jgi:tetratricopeptide (TPR) repeat protein
LGSLASIHFQERDFEQALELYSQARDIEITYFGQKHLQVAQTLHNIAMTCLHLNALPEAKTTITRAIEIKRANSAGMEQTSIDLAVSLLGLGDILKVENSNLELAKLVYEETLQIYEGVHGKNYFEIPYVLMGLADVAKKAGDLDEAFELLQRAMRIHESSVSVVSYSPQYVQLLEMIGDVEKERERPEYAEKHYADCLQGLLQLSPDPERDPSIARIKFNIAVLGMETRPIEETISALRDVAAIYGRVFGRNDLSLALTLHTLAAALVRQGGKIEEAMKTFEEALKVRIEILGSINELVGDSLTDMGYVLLVQERYAEAEAKFQQAVDTYMMSFRDQDAEDGDEHPKLALAHYHLANACYMLNKQMDAERSFGRALQIARKALGNDHPQVKSLEDMVQKLLPNTKVLLG